MRWITYLICGVGLVSFFNPLVFAEEKTQDAVFLSVADIHFDPFISCKKSPRPCPLLNSLRKEPYQEWEKIFQNSGESSIGGPYQDTNYPLLKSSLIELHQIYEEKHPRFVLVLGDFLGHHYRRDFYYYSKDYSRADAQAFIKKTLEFLTYELKKTFPDIDVYPAVGNNDSYTGDYSVIPHGEFLKETSFTWEKLILNEKNRESFLSTFPQAGYYSVTVPHESKHKIILLNTVLFSEKSKNKGAGDAAYQQLKWLHQSLETLKNHDEKTLLAFHIPIGLDIFASLRSNFSAKPFWKAEYVEIFEKDLKDFAPQIIAMFPAHIHIEILHRIFAKEFSGIPVDFTPSISPIFGNNPGFKVVTYDPETFSIKSIQTYYLPLSTVPSDWNKELGFNKQWLYRDIDISGKTNVMTAFDSH